jgi:hypothetical protein
MKKILATIVAITMVMAMVAPAMASVTTSVTVQSGGGSPPIIKAKWEQDTTAKLEDGDPSHTTLGSQFLPPLVFGGVKEVWYYAVVTDPNGVNTITQVSAYVYHPDDSYKYKVPLTKVVGDPTTLINLFNAAYAAGLVTLNDGMTIADILDQLDKGTAQIWSGRANLDYHQPGGNYKVEVDAFDGLSLSEKLINTFLYVPGKAFEIDFTNVDYGTVLVSSEQMLAGDKDFTTPNRPTVRNVGNMPIQLTVNQDDMGFGKDVNNIWQVEFDARLGSDNVNKVVFDPFVTTTLPNLLPNCNTEELDFSIHVKQGTPGTTYNGIMTIGFVP